MFWTIVKIVWLLTGPMGFAVMLISICLHDRVSPNRFFEEEVQSLCEDEELQCLPREVVVVMCVIGTVIHMIIPFMGWRAFIKDWRNIYHTKEKEPSN